MNSKKMQIVSHFKLSGVIQSKMRFKFLRSALLVCVGLLWCSVFILLTWVHGCHGLFILTKSLPVLLTRKFKLCKILGSTSGHISSTRS